MIKSLNWKIPVYGAIAGVLGFLPAAIAGAQVPSSVAGVNALELKNCTSFKSQFKGVFDWVPNQYCSASGFAMFAITTLLNLAGTVAILFLIVGGFFYLASAGNEEQSEKGKKIITNSIIGLVVIILASVIVRLIAGLINNGG